MPETSAQNLEAAYRLIDSVTRMKGVIGAMLVDKSGEIVAQDFLSQDQAAQCAATGKNLIPAFAKAGADLKLGAVNDVLFQTATKTIRFVRQQAIWMVVIAGDNANIGMLNVELRGFQDQLKVIGGGAVMDEREAQKQRVLDVLKTERGIGSILDERSSDIGQLRGLHGVMFQVALDVGVTRQTISRRINDINYRLYRDSLLDIGFDFFNRKALDNYDPVLAKKVMREQIIGLASMIVPNLK